MRALLQQGFTTGEIGFQGCSNPEPLMSALGQKQTLERFNAMSALLPKAGILRYSPSDLPSVFDKAAISGPVNRLQPTGQEHAIPRPSNKDRAFDAGLD
jgi:hypothetical protein